MAGTCPEDKSTGANAGERKEVDEAEARREEMREGHAFGGKRSCEMRRFDSVWAILARALAIGAGTDPEASVAAGRSARPERRLDSTGIDRQEGISRLPAE